MRGSQKNKNYKIKWTPEFAYAIGLLTTDGNLSNDGRHFDFTSKDIQLLETFKECLGLDNKITKKTGSYFPYCYHVQFGNKKMYEYLLKIGLTPNKTKTIGVLKIPDKFFFDFLRGHFDGDGSCYSYWDERWRNSFMFYTAFVSASHPHLQWLRQEIKARIDKQGKINKARGVWQLRYAKQASMILWNKMYYKATIPCLLRKKNKIKRILKIQAQVA